MSKPKKNLEKARQIKGLGNSGLKNVFPVCHSAGVVGRAEPNVQHR